MKKIVFLILFFGLTSSYCQQIKVKTSLFFASDKYELTNKHKKVLKAFLDSIPQNDTNRFVRINSVLISGNTDNDADSLYNIQLSEKRALSVSSYLIGNGIKTNKYKQEFYGENKPLASNDKSEGKQQNRRVDIYISYSIINLTKKEVPVKEKKNIVRDTCLKDTTIVLPQGTVFIMNRCEYLRIKDSLKITEYLTPKSIQESNLTTLSETNEQLFTAGMWNFKFPKDTCLKKPLIIRVPVDSCLSRYRMMLWIGRSNGRWGNPQLRRVKIVTVGNQKFYQFTVLCPGNINLDVYAPKVGPTVFKAKNKLKLVEVSLIWDCPRSVISFKKDKPMKKLSGKITRGEKSTFVNIKAVTRQGELLSVTNKKLATLKYRRFLFKRYIIFEKDFRN